MNIVLIGYRCAGKTAVGEILARKLSRDFVDTDALIEQRAGCSIEALVCEKGWPHFRAMEKEMIEAASRTDRQVIATGGGAVMDEANLEHLKRKGWVVWLKGHPEVLKKRMGMEEQTGHRRPSLTGEDVLEEIRRVLDMRTPLYEGAADHVVDTSTLDMEAVAALILAARPNEGE